MYSIIFCRTFIHRNVPGIKYLRVRYILVDREECTSYFEASMHVLLWFARNVHSTFYHGTDFIIPVFQGVVFRNVLQTYDSE